MTDAKLDAEGNMMPPNEPESGSDADSTPESDQEHSPTPEAESSDATGDSAPEAGTDSSFGASADSGGDTGYDDTPAGQEHLSPARPDDGDNTITFSRPPGMVPPPAPTQQPSPVPVQPSQPPTQPAPSARVADAVRAARSAVSSAAGRGPRRARLRLKRIDPWSVMKFSFAVSLVLFIVVIVATTVLYIALDAMGVFDTVNDMLAMLLGSAEVADEGVRITARAVIGIAALLGIVNMVLFTALSTLGAFIYNVCSDLVGGIEVTLAERE